MYKKGLTKSNSKNKNVYYIASYVNKKIVDGIVKIEKKYGKTRSTIIRESLEKYIETIDN